MLRQGSSSHLAARCWDPNPAPSPQKLHHWPRCPLDSSSLAGHELGRGASHAEQRRPALQCLCKESKRCTEPGLGQLVSVRILRLISLFF